jgi:C4-type Zn-finger protein
MNKTIIFLALLIAITTSASNAQTAPKDSMQTMMAVKKYTCPMHPEVIKDKPGKCPKCRMTLVEKKMEMPTYTCPMHNEVSKSKPGKCPKCGMRLKKVKMDKKMEDMKR